MSKEVMQQALEALKVSVPVILGNFSRHSKAIAALEALAEQPAQQQEPVDLEAVYETIIRWDIGGGKRSRRELARRIVALYTSPPTSKPWVGLTDDEIAKMPAWIYSPDQDGMTVEEGLETFARAIEIKLKEKNT